MPRKDVELVSIRAHAPHGRVTLDLQDRGGRAYYITFLGTVFIGALKMLDGDNARDEAVQIQSLAMLGIQSEPHTHLPHDVFYLSADGHQFNLGPIFDDGVASQLVALMRDPEVAGQLRRAIVNSCGLTVTNRFADL